MLKLPTYVDVLERAVIAEGNLAAQKRTSEWKGKRQNNQWSRGLVTPPNKKLNSGNSSTTTPAQNSSPVCPDCGRQHLGLATGRLELVLSVGTRTTTSSARSIPTPNAKVAAKPTNNKDTTRQGRVFALVPGDVQNAATVVSGTFIVHGHSAHVLFDSGSTHSFMSKLFTPNLDKTEENLSYMLCVSSPLGDSMICTSVYLACELQLGDIRVYANLLPLDMTYFDVILGMDWLSDYGATINCLTKKISFHPLGQSESIVQGQEVTSPPYLISVVKACKLFQKGCQGYFCSILEGQVMNGDIDMIPVVREFRMSFPKNCQGN
ncbi:uncharacterized protein LOC114309173 [Camellia sinensis]|uniref:uncharacterized protein LOC114309173 n=1 Tax=Camellia sinensis TaxID=4442 RepID=UPI00103699F1|nr:uncharacterized protein LOC114309173 [Camellia sinensis]